MSNIIQGYAQLSNSACIGDFSRRVRENNTPISLIFVSWNQLFTLYPFLMPAHKERCVPFIISDSPQTNVATYLVDGVDYAPEAEIDLPILFEDRLSIFVDLIDFIFSIEEVESFAVSICESNFVDIVHYAHHKDILALFTMDMKNEGPTNTLWIIKKNWASPSD